MWYFRYTYARYNVLNRLKTPVSTNVIYLRWKASVLFIKNFTLKIIHWLEHASLAMRRRYLWPRWGPSLSLVEKWLLWASQHITSGHPLASTERKPPTVTWQVSQHEETPAVFGMETNKKAHRWPSLLIIPWLSSAWSHLLRSESAHTWCDRENTSLF